MRPLLIALLLASPASADMLLATIQRGGHIFDPGVMPPNKLSIAVEVSAPCCTFAGFERIVTPSDQGSVFEATTEEIAGMNESLAMGPGSRIFITTLYDSVWIPTSQFWHTPSVIVPAVSPLGPGLDGYRLTRATITVDQLVWRNESNPAGPNPRLFADAHQTVRLYAVAVPEPAAFALVVIVVVHLIGRIRVQRD